ncbi:MAG TPA: hypothetical protein VI299_11700 [Polyangiales bacterium]
MGWSWALLALAACQEDSKAPQDAPSIDGGVAVCDMTPPSSCPDNPPRYPDVKPIFAKYCSGCHGKDWTGAWPLDTYPHVADWADVIQGQLLTCDMPPADAGVPLPADKRRTLVTWIQCGARE